MLRRIGHELKHHAPFTLVGTVIGAVVLAALIHADISPGTSVKLFGVFHPLHVLLSAVVTTSMYRLHGRRGFWVGLLIGYVGAIGIGTLSDSLIPYVGELLFHHADAHVHAPHAHIGFIEFWWLVNPLALGGVAIGWWWPHTKIPHAGHVLLSTAASLFHITTVVGHTASVWTLAAVPVFLFAAVWLPCCTSDIVFPLLFVPKEQWPACKHCHQ